jgi:hypothetical protein
MSQCTIIWYNIVYYMIVYQLTSIRCQTTMLLLLCKERGHDFGNVVNAYQALLEPFAFSIIT